ncbi:C-type lectin-like [Trinorchestia longiramus]|nr:C-type lectin-like [Trinorchestia longiramus]
MCCQLGQLVSESACERKDPGSNPATDKVDAARNTAWDLGKQPNNYRSNYPTQEWARRVVTERESHSTEVWVSSLLDETAMEESGEQPESHFTRSAMHCLALSQALGWGQASCFTRNSSGAQCRTWNEKALIKVAARWNGTVGTTTCKIRKSFVRCFLNDGSLIAINSTFGGACDEAFRCTENGIKLIEKLDSCSEPFEDTTAGCLYIEPAQMDWCRARQKCKTLGGDLYTANTSEEFENLRQYLRNIDTDYGHLWVAMKKIDGEWQWLPSGRSPGPDNQGDWANSDPDGADKGHECARIMKNKDFKLGDIKCDTNDFNALCQVI